MLCIYLARLWLQTAKSSINCKSKRMDESV